MLEQLGTDAGDAAVRVELFCEKILNTLGLAYTLEGQEFRSAPSIGVSLFGPVHNDALDVLRQADMAIYKSKSAGGATFRFFDPCMQSAIDASTNLDADLRFALARREFELYYQPVVNSCGIMTGAEALLRWNHPRNSFTLPNAFIEQAEKAGLIVDIGEWVLLDACKQLANWRNDSRTAGLTLAVNVSAR